MIVGFAPDAIATHLNDHSPLMRLLVVETAGSTPRETGTNMLVWMDGIAGTIGGGALEHEAIRYARKRLSDQIRNPTLRTFPLGPGLGQCCGGSLTILFEPCTPAMLAAASAALQEHGLYARPASSRAPTQDATIAAGIRAMQVDPNPSPVKVVKGWVLESAARPAVDLWIFGAGHVGRAIVTILRFNPSIRMTWVDFAADRFPAGETSGPDILVVRNPADATGSIKPGARCLVLTHSHDLDLEICHRLLILKFTDIGLIGSATKWSRFRKRLLARGHTEEAASQITCPIGDPALGKDPWSIAIGVAATIAKSHSGELQT